MGKLHINKKVADRLTLEQFEKWFTAKFAKRFPDLKPKEEYDRLKGKVAKPKEEKK